MPLAHGFYAILLCSEALLDVAAQTPEYKIYQYKITFAISRSVISANISICHFYSTLLPPISVLALVPLINYRSGSSRTVLCSTTSTALRMF